MHVDRIPNRTSLPAFLLRETYREDGKVKKRTLANITHWPAGKIEALRRLLRDEYAPDLKLMRSPPHGPVAAARGMLRKLGLDDLLAQGQRQRARMVALVTALVVARLLDPASKLTTARLLDGTTATSSLGTVLALGKVDEQELYDALDWLLAQQERIETALARRHLSLGTLVLHEYRSWKPRAWQGFHGAPRSVSCEVLSASEIRDDGRAPMYNYAHPGPVHDPGSKF